MNAMSQTTRLQPYGLNTPVTDVAAQTTFAAQPSPSVSRSPAGFPLYSYQFANGHRLLIEQRPATDVVSMRTFIDSGSIYEDPVSPNEIYRHTGFPSGLAHLDEHARFLTTQHFPQKNTWSRVVEEMGTRLNASTDDEIIQHELTFNKEVLPRMVPLHAESVLNPLYDEALLNQERTNVINEAREKTKDLSFKMLDVSLRELFDRERLQTLGSEADVRRTTAKHLEAFHQKYYRPDHMLTVVSGNVNPNEVARLVSDTFGKNPPRSQPVQEQVVQLTLGPKEKRLFTVADPDITLSRVALSFPAPDKRSLKDRLAMELLLMDLASGPYARLERLLSDRLKLGYNLDMFYIPMKNTGMTTLMFQTDPGKEVEALGAALGMMRQVGQDGLSPQTLAELKTRLAHEYRRGLDDVDTVTMVLGEEALHGSGDYYLNFLKGLEQVQPADVQRVAKQFLNPERYVAVFGVPEKQTATRQLIYPNQPLARPLATVATPVQGVAG